MTTKYKHITFGYAELNRNYNPPKLFYLCYNNDNEDLGVVEWYDPWNQYVYHDICNGFYSQSCLLDINDFLSQLNKNQKGK